MFISNKMGSFNDFYSILDNNLDYSYIGETIHLCEIIAVKKEIKPCLLTLIRDQKEEKKFYNMGLHVHHLYYIKIQDRNFLIPLDEKRDNINKADGKYCLVYKNYYSVFDTLIDILNHNNKDDYISEIGKILGYPECCVNFYKNKFQEGIYDPAWFQVENSVDQVINYEDDYIKIKKDSNISLFHAYKVIGLYTLSHYVCSLNCEESLNYHNLIMNELDKSHRKLYNILNKFYSSPFEWKCNRGRAVFRNKYIRYTYPTSYSTKRYLIIKN